MLELPVGAQERCCLRSRLRHEAEVIGVLLGPLLRCGVAARVRAAAADAHGEAAQQLLVELIDQYGKRALAPLCEAVISHQ